jgi:hypothetical protein
MATTKRPTEQATEKTPAVRDRSRATARPSECSSRSGRPSSSVPDSSPRRASAPACPAIAREALTGCGAAMAPDEPVNEVVYGTRGFDTFGETFLLLAAVVSVTMLTRSARGPRRLFRRAGRAAGGASSGDRSRPECRRDESRGSGRRDAGAVRRIGDLRPARPTRTTTARIAGSRAMPSAMSVVTRTAVRTRRAGAGRRRPLPRGLGLLPRRRVPGGAVILGVILLLGYAAFGRRVARFVRPGCSSRHRAGRRGADHPDRAARPAAQGLVQRELAAAGRARTIRSRRDRPALLRQRADRGGHGAVHRRLRADRRCATTGHPTGTTRPRPRRTDEAAGMIVVNYLARRRSSGPRPVHGADPAQHDQDGDGPVADGGLDVPV